MSIFEQTIRPNADLLYARNDANDVRLGETVSVKPEEYTSADVVLLGLPQDEGVRRNKGRVGAGQAPDAIRRSLYKLVTIAGLKFFDVGNTMVQDVLEATHSLHHEIVREILQAGKTLVVLGGGNDTSYPDCSALATETAGVFLAFNIDAHFDVRADKPCNSGTPYRQLLEEKFLNPALFYEVAYQPFANSSTYSEYLIDKGVTLYDLHHVHQVGIAALLKTVVRSHKVDAIFWGLDMDVVRAADAPGVSAVNATGLTGEEFCSIGHIAGSTNKTRLFEITEVNPAYDLDERTCKLAAAAIWHFLAAYNKKQHTR